MVYLTISIELAEGKSTTYEVIHVGKLVESYEFETGVTSATVRGISNMKVVFNY